MESNLDTIVDEPLEGSQCTDHDDTGNKTLPDTLWTQFLQDLKKRFLYGSGCNLKKMHHFCNFILGTPSLILTHHF